MAAYQALDYANTPPQAQAFVPMVRPFNAVVNSGGTNVITLGVGDTIALGTLPGQGTGIVVLNWAISFGIIDTGTGVCALSLGLALNALDPGMTSAAAVGFFATGIVPGATGGFISGFTVRATMGATIVLGALSYSISDYAPNLNGGSYDLVLQVTTAAGTVSAVNAFIRGWVEYAQISQAWAN
jgi:hypothetical protein